MGGSVFGEPMADDQIDASFIKTFIRRFFAQCQSMALAPAGDRSQPRPLLPGRIRRWNNVRIATVIFVRLKRMGAVSATQPRDGVA